MACSKKNVLLNSRFRMGLNHWYGTHMKVVQNPLKKKDLSVLMGDKSTVQNPVLMCILKQNVKGPFEHNCAYYLRFRLLHAMLLEKGTEFYASVAYRDKKGRILNSTPLFILPNRSTLYHWFFYQAICPPPPYGTRSLSVSFILRRGLMYIDNIELTSQKIGTKRELPGKLDVLDSSTSTKSIITS